MRLEIAHLNCRVKCRVCIVTEVKRKSFDWSDRWQISSAPPGFISSTPTKRVRSNSLILSAAFAIAFFSVPPAHAQLTILHSFGDGSVANDGALPEDGLIQGPDGNFYGVTLKHAAADPRGGTIFQITSSGTLTIVESYGHPYAVYAPLYYNKELIGNYFGRDKQHPGVVFSLTGYPNGPWHSHIWHVFGGEPNDGSDPIGRLILGSDGNLYGVTNTGGIANEGTMYQVDPASHQVTIVYSFTASPAISPVTSLLLASDGNYYGGGSPSSPPGEIYEMTSSGTVTTFFQFSGDEYPSGPLIEGSDGNFYGTGGGISSGASFVFQLTTAGTLTVLHTFTPASPHSGVDTLGVVQGPNGYLYGLTNTDGTARKGTVYEVSTDGSTFKVLHNFGDGSVKNDGEYPGGVLTVGADGNLYGVTLLGGSAGDGTVFKISP